MKNINKFTALFLAVILAVSCFAASVNAADTGKTPQNLSNVVILVKFADDSADTFNGLDAYEDNNWEEIKAMYDDTSSRNQYNIDLSFKKYISEISNGQVIINNCFPQDTGTSVNTYTLSKARSEYSDDYYILQEIIDATRDGRISIPSSFKLDNRENEVLDNLTILFQVSGDVGNDEMLYPHKSVAANSVKLANRAYVRCYNFLNSYAVLQSQFQGVITHEFMHSMGFSDLYRYADGSGSPVGAWDIMSQTGRYLQYPLTYFRQQMGWVSMDKITTPGDYTLNPVTTKEGNQAFIIETPMSDSEFFVVEYRVRDNSAPASLAFESKVPQTGLLVYRINTAVEEMSNSQGNDYCYIFRPGETSLTASAGQLLYASVSPSSTYNPRTSIGSTDLSKQFSGDTIFYSDGKNSGISITDVAIDSETNTLSFNVSFADYSSIDMWEKLGENIASDCGNVSSDTVADNEIYVAYESSDYTSFVKAAVWNGSSWTALGNTVSNASSPVIKKVGDNIYLFYQNNGTPTVAKLNGSLWSVIGSTASGTYPQGCDIITDGTDAYITYTVADAQNVLHVDKITASGLASFATYQTSQYIVNPKLSFYNSSLYAIFSLFDGSSTQIMKAASGSFSLVKALPMTYGNAHGISVSDGKLWCFVAKSNADALLSVFDGVSWNDRSIPALNEIYSDNEFTVINSIAYIARISGTDNTLKVYSYSDSTLTQIGENVLTNANDSSLGITGSTVYALSATGGNGTLSVRYKQLTAHEHVWNNGEITTDATCTANGVKTFTCTLCSDTKTEVIPAYGHHDYTSVITPATCYSDSFTTFTCAEGDYSYVETNAGTKLSHAWDNGVITTNATCTADGVKTFTCTLCSDTKTEAVPKISHSIKTETKKADCTNGGFTRDICTVCGTVLRIYDETPALGHIDGNEDNICDSCGAVLGSLQDDCDCICHSTGFMQFIYKIMRFFYKLFGINKTCKCGIEHY